MSKEKEQTYTGKTDLCMNCSHYTTIDKRAELHSREMKHSVFQDMVICPELGKVT